jgi:dihydropteroate synthase
MTLDRPRLMGILNVTPDSFSDGGMYPSSHAAVDAALRMIDDGAAIIDIGGESTRPGAQRVSANEQIRRVVPVIEALRAKSDVAVSIDTTLRAVAQAALDAGADIINDVAAGTEDESIFDLAAARQCGIVLMHRRVRPEDDSFSDRYGEDASRPQYDDVVQTVGEFLAERASAAMAAGIDAAAIVIDPGLGFGKTVEQNFELIARTDELARLGYPILSAASRKSFIGAVTGVERPVDRVSGSVAVSVLHWMQGVRLFRVHDIAAHREALAVADSVTQPAQTTPIP